MASPTRYTWVWVNSRSWWWTGRPGVLRFMGLQRVGHDWATGLNWTEEQASLTLCPFTHGLSCGGRFTPSPVLPVHEHSISLKVFLTQVRNFLQTHSPVPSTSRDSYVSLCMSFKAVMATWNYLLCLSVYLFAVYLVHPEGKVHESIVFSQHLEWCLST